MHALTSSSGSAAAFERILSSSIAPAELRARSLGDLVFEPRDGERDDEPIILGCFDRRMLTVTLGQLRHAVLGLSRELASSGLKRGDTVCLVRLPRTSEALCAVAYAALSACGLRVLLPMYVELERFSEWLERARVKVVLWSAAEVDELSDHASDRALLAQLTSACSALDVPCRCLLRDLGVLDLIEGAPAGSPEPDARIEALRAPALDEECLLLTTSGTSGLTKLVRYRQAAILRGCASWEAAGLFRPERHGGRGLCLLFAHSMGVRAFWNAVWTRKAVCLVTPEWFVEHPERVRALLLEMRAEHVTGGPAVFRALLELMRVFPEAKSSFLRDLRCAVSTGAPFDPEMARRFEVALGVKLRNAFGMTETMQVSSSLLDEREDADAYLGEPLPGVRLGLERCPGEGEPTWRLHVSTACGSAGYVEDGTSPPASGRPGWLATGDLVVATLARAALRGPQ